MDRQTRILCLYLRACIARDRIRRRWIDAALARNVPAMKAAADRMVPTANRAKALLREVHAGMAVTA